MVMTIYIEVVLSFFLFFFCSVQVKMMTGIQWVANQVSDAQILKIQ